MAARILIFTVFLFVVADLRAAAWPVAVVAVPLALLSSTLLGAGTLPRIRVGALLRFVPYFLAASVRGGIDVTLRAVARRPRIDPGLIRYPLALRSEAARLVFADALSLLPGTLCADVHGDALTIHTLDRSLGDATLRLLERRVGALVGEQL